MYLYVVRSSDGEVCNQYWDKKDIEGIESVINMYSSRTPTNNGWDRSNKDAIILNIIEVNQ